MNLNGVDPLRTTPQKDFDGVGPHDPEEFDPALLTPSLTLWAAVQQTGARALNVVGTFVLGQGAIQATAIFSGFFLVRNLSVESYAQFGIVTGFQTVFTVLMDLGFAGTIIPLIGDRGNDPLVVGRYVRAARHLRNRMFYVLTPIAAIAFVATVHKQHWPWHFQILLLASVLISLYSSGVMSYFSAPLFVLGKLKEFYVPQFFSGIGRILAYIWLLFAGCLNSWTATGIAALTISLNGFLIRRSARKHMVWPDRDNIPAERELLRTVLPALPAIVFSAFQSQISLFLISFFGSTLYIAEVAALGRIGGLFTLLMTFNTVIIEPHVARASRDGLHKKFLGFILMCTFFCLPLVVLAFLAPGIFVFILGSHFQGIRSPIGWYVLAASLNSISGLIWVMNRARKWVFWSGSLVEVVLLLAVQIVFLMFVGVHTTRQAVLFNLASSGCYMIAHGYVSLRGFAMKDSFEHKPA